MKKIAFIAWMLWPCFASAQLSEARGSIVDSIHNSNISNAVVAFLRVEDSTLVSFVRTDPAGNFRKSVPPGNYLVLITCPTYADFVTRTIILPDQSNNLGRLFLLPRASVLEEVIISQRTIRIKGDTTEYMADSFRLKPNATVEDLLKQLPGLQVSSDGTVTAQGQTVKKILVDGEEFFSDDPTIVTKNLRADAVQKVQVFDKKSDQAALTGIDDGKREKTINLELKDESKQGYFGTVAAGGLDRYYNFRAMINAFRKKRKLAAFAVAGTTSATGLDWTIAGNYGFSAANVQTNEETGVTTVSGKNADEMGSGNFSGQGLPESLKGGLHYSNTWKADRYKLNSNYLFNRLQVRTADNEFARNILPDSVFFNRTNSSGTSLRLRHSLTGSYEMQFDSSSSLKISVNGSAGHNESFYNYQVSNTAQNGIPVNESNRLQNYNGESQSESINLFYSKKFKKQGQAFSLSLNQQYNSWKLHGQIIEGADFYGVFGNFLKTDSINQRSKEKSTALDASLRAAYTLPISLRSFLGFSYGYEFFDSRNHILNHSRNSITDDYTDPVDSLSTDFKYIYHIHSAGLSYRLVTTKINFSLGSTVLRSDFLRNDLWQDTSGRSTYFNVYPKASLKYRFSTSKNLSVEYNGSTFQPTIEQVQPLKDNSDPLTIRLGNPNLKPSFQHNFNVLYNSFRLLNSIYFFLGGQVTLVNNEVNTSYNIAADGRRILKYVNTDNNYTAGIYGVFNMQIPKSVWRIGAGPILWVYRYTNYINNLENITLAQNLSWRFTAAARIPEKMDLDLALQPGYRASQSSINKDASTGYAVLNFSLNSNYQLPGKFEIGTDFNGNLRQRTTTFDSNNNLYLWNAYVEKRFLKEENLSLRFSFFDILDQNKGYDRYELGERIMEQRYLTFGQYGLLQISYNFKNKGAKAPATIDGIHL